MIERIIEYWQHEEYIGLDKMAEDLGVTRGELEEFVEPAAKEQISRAIFKWRV